MTAEDRHLQAVRAGIASGLKKAALPAGYQIPEFADPDSIIVFARELGRLALTADVDMRRLAEARGAAALALSAHQAQSQARLVDALLRLERGGPAVALLSQFMANQDGEKRPLPGRVISLPGSDAS